MGGGELTYGGRGIAGSLSATDSSIERPAITSVVNTDHLLYCYGTSYH